MRKLSDVQRAIGEVLIPEARASQTQLPSLDQSLAVALELFYTAMSMKQAHQQAARFIARRFAERMGLDGGEVERFAETRLITALEDTNG